MLIKCVIIVDRKKLYDLLRVKKRLLNIIYF